jgi:pyridoxine 5-phosphate synthase
MVRLGVNIDHIATIRQARRAQEPDPVQAAFAAELGGADGITVHLRADRRHIQDRDVRLLREVVRTRLNVELAATPEMLQIALELEPDQVTLVPERPEEVTTEGGLDVLANDAVLEPAIRTLKDAGIHVSLFVDPVAAQVRRSRELKPDAIEINTASYSEAAPAERENALRTLATTAAQALGVQVHAGHGLNYQNVAAVAAIGEIVELNIGHSIVSRAAFVGLERAVREMKAAMRGEL